jgi:hypothetical protein
LRAKGRGLGNYLVDVVKLEFDEFESNYLRGAVIWRLGIDS